MIQYLFAHKIPGFAIIPQALLIGLADENDCTINIYMQRC